MTDTAVSADAAPVVRLADVRFAWTRSGADVVDIPAFSLAPGSRSFLRGPSGSGKTTLLNLIAGVLVPRSGRVEVLGTDVASLSGAARDRFRADHIGFVFQMFNLLPYLSVLDNVLLPCRFSARRRAAAAAGADQGRAEAHRLLGALGLDAAAQRAGDVTELSVGQQQRVALARGLIGRPELVVADEPTSALDADSRDDFLALLEQECAAAGSALLFVSHDAALAPRFEAQFDMTRLNRAGGPPS